MATARRPKKPAAPSKKPALPKKKKPAPEAALPKKAAAPISKARARYEALLHEIEIASVDEHRGWDRKWEAAGTILSKQYFMFDDEAPTASQWVEKHLGEKHRTALRNARVAKIASPDEEKKYTVTKIDLAYTIELGRKRAQAKTKGVVWAEPKELLPIDLAKLRYDVVRDGKKRTVDLAEISINELRALQRGDSRESGAESARVSPFMKALLSRFTKKNGLSNVATTERNNEYDFSRVRRDQFAALGRVLLALAEDDSDG